MPPMNMNIKIKRMQANEGEKLGGGGEGGADLAWGFEGGWCPAAEHSELKLR